YAHAMRPTAEMPLRPSWRGVARAFLSVPAQRVPERARDPCTATGCAFSGQFCHHAATFCSHMARQGAMKMPMCGWMGKAGRQLRQEEQEELAEAVLGRPGSSEAGDAGRVEAVARSALRTARRLVSEAGSTEARVPGLFEQPVLYFLAHWPTAVRVG